MSSTINHSLADDGQLSFGFHYGQTHDGWMWLRNHQGDYKKVDASVIVLLKSLSRISKPWQDHDIYTSLSSAQKKAIETLSLEGYLIPGQAIVERPAIDDVVLWPRVTVFVALLLILIGIVVQKFELVINREFELWLYLFLIPYFLLVTMLHELGHYLACRPYFKPKIRFAVLHKVFPSMVVLTGDAWACPRNVRIWISLAGPFVDIVIALGVAVVHLVFFPDVALLSLILFIQLIRVILVLNPLVESDGYWCFSDLFGVVNLRTKAHKALKQRKLNAYSLYIIFSYFYIVLSLILAVYFLSLIFKLTWGVQ